MRSMTCAACCLSRACTITNRMADHSRTVSLVMGWSMRARVSGVRRPLSQATRQKLSMLPDSRNARYASQMVMSSGVVFWCSFWCHCSMNPSSMPCSPQTLKRYRTYRKIPTFENAFVISFHNTSIQSNENYLTYRSSIALIRHRTCDCRKHVRMSR